MQDLSDNKMEIKMGLKNTGIVLNIYQNSKSFDNITRFLVVEN